MMEEFALYDGELRRTEPRRPQPLYLYQTVHVDDRYPARLDDHLRLLDRHSRRLFGRPFTAGRAQVEAEIRRILEANRIPRITSFVRLELTAGGERIVRFAETSLYRGYALRSLRPSAVTVGYDLPTGEAPTALREEAARWAQHYAERHDARCALRCDGTGMALTADDAPLVAVKGLRCYTSPAPESVERMLLADAVTAAGLELHEQPVDRSQLPDFDELLYVDHRGVTALSACDGQPYMDIIARRIAAAMNLF